jgi:hypothetical protein
MATNRTTMGFRRHFPLKRGGALFATGWQW